MGILAHVDAGKTTLTERLLYAAGVIDEVGSVDDGSTLTDSLALERQRGITIKSAVVSFTIGDVVVNLIDTPGHPDFIAEVERVLSVLDGVVLVVSAVEGVQAQTRVLWRALQRLKIPTLIFVNKIDRAGAQYESLLDNIAEKLTSDVVAMGEPSAIGTRTTSVEPYGPTDVRFRDRLVDVLASHDDAVLTAYVEDDPTLTDGELLEKLATQTKQSQVHPVFFGSAITGIGVESLMSGLTQFLPASEPDSSGPVRGRVFKVDRRAGGQQVAYVRMFSGTLRTRDVVQFGDSREGKVTAVRVFQNGSEVLTGEAGPGQIAVLRGLDGVRIGDEIGDAAVSDDAHFFAPPTLETVVVPAHPSEKGRLHAALAQLAEQDPLIDLRQDDLRQEVYISLFGEVQKEVIQATLADEYDLEVGFEETTTVHIERPTGTGAAFELMSDDANPFRATVGLQVEPGSVGSGVQFRLEVELGSMPYAFFKAVEETVRQTLQQGIHGWQVTDIVITMTHSGFVPPPPGGGWSSVSSSAGDFRQLTPLVLMSALKQAATEVYAPIHRFHLEVPTGALGQVMPALARLHAIPLTQAGSDASYAVEGDIPAAQVHALQQELPGLTQGEGVLESAFDHYEPVRGSKPTRRRTDHNPLNRQEYMLQVAHRI